MAYKYKAIKNLSLEYTINNYFALTFPAIQKKALSMPLDEPFYGVLALNEEKPVGLVLADNSKDKGYSELISVFTIPKERNKTIGQKMLEHLETLLRQEGAALIQGRYWNTWGGSVYFDKMLDLLNWETKKVLRYICDARIIKYDSVEWPTVKIPSGYELVLLNNLSDEQKKSLVTLANGDLVPLEFIPLQHADKIFYPTSLALLYNKNVVGWNIAFSLNSQKLEYNNLFLFPEHRKRGIAIELIRESCRLQNELKIPEITWIVNAGNEAMLKILQTLFSLHLDKLIEVHQRSKKL